MRFSWVVVGLLVISLPLKLSYFSDESSKEVEIAGRQALGWQIAEFLEVEGFAISLQPTDGFLPSVAAVKDACVLYITPLPVLNDLDASFLHASRNYGDMVVYFYDGKLTQTPPIYVARFWEYAARHLPKIGISLEKRLRLGVAYSAECDLIGLSLGLGQIKD